MSALTQELVGRAEELARIDRFLDGVGHGSGAFVLEGDAGIGKTTLWLAGVERARERGLRVLLARPAEAERELSFAALSDLLADVHESIRRLRPPQRRALTSALLLDEDQGVAVAPRAVAVGLLEVLRALARDRPLLVAVDDVQWADPASAAALSFAFRRAVGQSIGVLLAQRTGLDYQPRLQLDRSESVERVVIGPLSLGALRQVLVDRLGLSFPRPVMRRLHERAGGNPFFALELARALQARGGRLSPLEELPVPRDLDRLLAERLRELPRETREPLAAVAALAEPTLGLVGEEILEPAFAAGVLVLDGERVRFAHPMLAAAAYQALTPPRRRALHRRLAGLVDDFEGRARHLALGAEGPDAGLASVLDEASVRARARGAPEAAADLAEWALRLGDVADREAVVRRSCAAAECRWLAGDFRRARGLVEAALSVEPVGVARARLLLQRARIRDEGTDVQIADVERALASATGDLALETEILVELARVITDARRIPDAEPYARRGLELAERVGDPVMLARALVAFSLNQFWLGRGFLGELMERALALDDFCESVPIVMRPLATAGLMCVWTGDLDRGRALLERACEIGSDRADATVYSVLWGSAAAEWFADDWQHALELAEEIYQVGVESEHDRIVLVALAARSLLYAHLGDEERTQRDVRDLFALDETYGSRFAVRHGPWALAVLELSLDRPRAALGQARAPTAEMRAEGIEEPVLFNSFPIHAEAAIACGELLEAEELLDWIEERAVRLDRGWALACCARCRGLLAAARGDEAAALAAFERALAEHGRLQHRRFDLARTLLAQGETLRRFRRKRAAREAIEAALAIFDLLGARLWSAKASRELARISGRKRADGLTETERRVAELVVAGRSNKEIAGELFVSVRTVETHLTKVYEKLAVRSRTELASRLPA